MVITKQHIDETLKQLAAIFPAWQAAIKTTEQANEIKRVWFDEMQRQRLTVVDLKQGILQARQSHSPYLPSLGQFINWCQPKKYLTIDRAWQIAAMSGHKEIENTFVAEAVRRTGKYDIINRQERDIKPLFKDHYLEVIDEAKQGAQFSLPPPKKPTEKIEHESIDREQQKKVIEQIMNMLGEK